MNPICEIMEHSQHIACKNLVDNPTACVNCIHNKFAVSEVGKTIQDNFIPVSN